jgi:hypothetical protein
MPIKMALDFALNKSDERMELYSKLSEVTEVIQVNAVVEKPASMNSTSILPEWIILYKWTDELARSVIRNRFPISFALSVNKTVSKIARLKKPLGNLEIPENRVKAILKPTVYPKNTHGR